MLADQDGNPLNSYGSAANIPSAAGLLEGYSNIHKFGAVPEMSQSTSGSIWDKSDTFYPWNAFSTAHTLTLQTYNSSGNLVSTDNGGTITVYGLDENYNEVSETIAISGNSGSGTQNFIRVYRAFFNGALSNTTEIRVSANSVEVLRINIGKAQTLMAVYTIPAGKTGYLLKGTASCAANADASVDMFVRYFGQLSFRIGHTLEIAGVGGQYTYDFPVPIKIPEKSDIDVRCEVRSNNARVTAAFDLILIDNP
jgi:hypothetical protein